MTNIWNGRSDNVSFSIPTFSENNVWGGSIWLAAGSTAIPASNCYVTSTWTGTILGNVINLYGTGTGVQNYTANPAYALELDCSYPNLSNAVPNIGINTFTPKSITVGGTVRFNITGSSGFVIINADLVSGRFRLNWASGTTHTASYDLSNPGGVQNFDVHITGTI